MKLFINWSNHPSSSWQEPQRKSAEALGRIVDISFPEVDPKVDIESISKLADSLMGDFIVRFPNKKETVVMVQGEMTLLYQLLRRLEGHGYRAVAASSIRDVRINADGSETKFFKFHRFRDYFLPASPFLPSV